MSKQVIEKKFGTIIDAGPVKESLTLRWGKTKYSNFFYKIVYIFQENYDKTPSKCVLSAFYAKIKSINELDIMVVNAVGDNTIIPKSCFDLIVQNNYKYKDLQLRKIQGTTELPWIFEWTDNNGKKIAGSILRTGDNNDGLELITWLASKNIFQNFIDKKYLRKKETNTGGSRIEKIEYSNKIEQGDYIFISTLGNNSIYGKVIDNSSRGIEIEISVFSLFGENKVRQIYLWNNIISVTKTPKNYEKQIIERMTKIDEEFARDAHIKWLQIPDEIIYTIYNSDK
jgi:hypothetical protein